MPLPQDKVFVSLTRPADFGGTHFGALIVNMVVTLYGFVLTDSLWAIAFALPIHGLCVAIFRHDPHAFRLLGLKLTSTAETIGNRGWWRAASRAPYRKRAL